MSEQILRRRFLKNGCGAGLCACAGSALLATGCQSESKIESAVPVETTPQSDPAWRLQWWLTHTQKQMARLWELLETHLDEPTRVSILEQLGRNCATNLGWAEAHKGDPEGFFRFMNEKAGEQFDYDRDKGVITVTTRERDCDCRMAHSKITPPIFCACSIGWQKHTYETLLGQKVDVRVKESVLRGSKRCVFVVTARA
jgi:predicted hydrocarbon binding protein